jgi:hypothetical protein
MLAARNEQQPTFEDATALRGGVSRCLVFVFSAVSSQRDAPRGKPVASKKRQQIFSGNERETPPEKPVASLGVFIKDSTARWY